MTTQLQFSALRCGAITLHRITEANFHQVVASFSGFPASDYMLSELRESCQPEYDEQGRQVRFGFYATINGVLAGGSILGVSSWTESLRMNIGTQY